MMTETHDLRNQWYDEPVQYETPMTEIEKVKAQIKVLQSKLSFLEELEKTKSPVEEAYKDWWGEYPGDENWTSDATRWQGFQAGYTAAYEEKVSEEPEEQKWDAVRESVKWCEEHPDKDPLDWLKSRDDFMDKMIAELKGQTLTDIIWKWWEDVFTTHEEWDAENAIEELVNRIESFLPKEQSAAGSQNAHVECTVEGFNDCLHKIKRKLR